jgi:hypothetical protein
MIIVRLLSPEPVGWIQHHQLYSGVGADIVMESITLKMPHRFLRKFLNPSKKIDKILSSSCEDPCSQRRANMTSETKPEELLGTKQIAAKLKIDPKTLRKHLRAISGKASGERYAWKPTVSLGRNRRRQRQPLRHHRNRRHLQLRRSLRDHTLAFVLSLGSRRLPP